MAPIVAGAGPAGARPQIAVNIAADSIGAARGHFGEDAPVQHFAAGDIEDHDIARVAGIRRAVG